MKKLKSILEQAKELAKTEEQKTAIDNMIADIDNSDVVEAYNAIVPQLVKNNDAEDLRLYSVGTNVDILANTMKFITGAAALWRSFLGWSQGSGNGYVPLLSLDGKRVLTAICYTPHHLAMPTNEVAEAFGEKYKNELIAINNFLTK